METRGEELFGDISRQTDRQTDGGQTFTLTVSYLTEPTVK